MSYTVLLTAVGGALSSQSAQYLKQSRRHDVRIVGVDARNDAAGRYFVDAFHQVPNGGKPDYVPAILDIIASEGVDLILPWSDEEALALANRRGDVEAGRCLLGCASTAMLRQLSDKDATFNLLKTHGIAVPVWRCAQTVDELQAAVAEFEQRGDFALKPARSRGNRDIYIVRSDVEGVTTTPSGRELHMDIGTFRDQYLGRLSARLPFLVMERLLSPAYDIDILSNAGEALRVVPRRRLNTEGMPFHGNVVVDTPELIDLGRRVAAAANLSWLYDVDVMMPAEGQPAVLEVNPRPSGSLAASVAAGVPLLDDLISFAKGETLPTCKVPHEELIVPYVALAKAGKPH